LGLPDIDQAEPPKISFKARPDHIQPPDVSKAKRPPPRLADCTSAGLASPQAELNKAKPPPPKLQAVLASHQAESNKAKPPPPKLQAGLASPQAQYPPPSSPPPKCPPERSGVQPRNLATNISIRREDQRCFVRSHRTTQTVSATQPKSPSAGLASPQAEGGLSRLGSGLRSASAMLRSQCLHQLRRGDLLAAGSPRCLHQLRRGDVSLACRFCCGRGFQMEVLSSKRMSPHRLPSSSSSSIHCHSLSCHR